MSEESFDKKLAPGAVGPPQRRVASVRTRMLAGAVSAMMVFALAVMLLSYFSAFRFKSAAAPAPAGERGLLVDISDLVVGGYRYIDVPQERPLSVSYRWLILRSYDGSISVLWLPQRNSRLLMPAAKNAGELAMFSGDCLEFLPTRTSSAASDRVVSCADIALNSSQAEGWQWTFAGKNISANYRDLAEAPFDQSGDKIWLQEP